MSRPRAESKPYGRQTLSGNLMSSTPTKSLDDAVRATAAELVSLTVACPSDETKRTVLQKLRHLVGVVELVDWDIAPESAPSRKRSVTESGVKARNAALAAVRGGKPNLDRRASAVAASPSREQRAAVPPRSPGKQSPGSVGRATVAATSPKAARFVAGGVTVVAEEDEDGGDAAVPTGRTAVASRSTASSRRRSSTRMQGSDKAIVATVVDMAFNSIRSEFLELDRAQFQGIVSTGVGRKAFCSAVRDRVSRHSQVVEDVFLNALDLFRDVLDAVLISRDVDVADELMRVASKLQDSTEYLLTRLGRHAIMHDLSFWFDVIRAAVARTEDEKERVAQAYLSFYAMNLCQIGVPGEAVRSFTDEVSNEFGLVEKTKIGSLMRMIDVSLSGGASSIGGGGTVADDSPALGRGESGRAAPKPGKRSKKQSKIGVVKVKVIAGRNLAPKDDNGLSDPYCIFKMSGQRYKTKIVHKTLNPEWNEEFVFDLTDTHAVINMKCWDNDLLSRDFMGLVTIPILPLTDGQPRNEWFYLRPHPRKKSEVSGAVRLELEFKSLDFVYEECGLDRGELEATVVRARNVSPKDRGGTSDPYCTVAVGSTRYKTPVVPKTLDPEWDDSSFTFPVLPKHTVIHVKMYDHDKLGKSTFMGQVAVPLRRLRDEQEVQEWYHLEQLAESKETVSGDILLSLKYTSWSTSTAVESKTLESFFPDFDAFVASPTAVPYFDRALREQHRDRLRLLGGILSARDQIRAGLARIARLTPRKRRTSYLDSLPAGGARRSVSPRPGDDMRSDGSASGGASASDGGLLAVPTSVDAAKEAIGKEMRATIKRMADMLRAEGCPADADEEPTPDAFAPAYAKLSTELGGNQYHKFLESPLAEDLLCECSRPGTKKGLMLYVSRVMPTLRSFLELDAGRDAFLAFVKSQFCEETFLAWQAIEEFQSRFQGAAAAAQVDEAALREAAKRIVDEYMTTGRPHEINVRATQRSEIDAIMAEDRIHANMFDSISSELLSLMDTNSFRPLIQRPELSDVVEAIRTVERARCIRKRFPTHRELVADADGHEFFVRFLRLTFQAEELHFCEDVAAFVAEQHLNVNHARKIYNTYIKDGVTNEIDVAERIKSSIGLRMDSGSSSTISHTIFDDAETASRENLDALYDAFVASPLGGEFALAAHIFP